MTVAVDGPVTPDSASPSPSPGLVRLANVLVPGGGLVLLGHTIWGWVLGVSFAVCANLALAGRLLFPDEVPLAIQNGSILAAAGAYIVAQGVCTRALAWTDASTREVTRRATLARIIAAIQAADAEAAWQALQPLMHEVDRDLLIAYRVAQVLELRADAAARAAWERVRRLDRHRIYRAELSERLRP